MNLIKKNIFLFSVLAVAMIISGVFIYMVVVETGEMNKKVLEAEKLKEEINELNKRSPIPSQENADKIEKDVAVIASKTEEVQQIFGHPYRNAMTAMVKELGISRDEFMKLWRKTYKEEEAKNSPRELIFNRFFAKFDKNKADKAIEAFKKSVEASSVEPLNEANIGGCIMEAMRLPRKMEPIPCKGYMASMQNNLIKYMEKTTSNNETPFLFGKGEKDSVVKKLTFEKFGDNALPRPDEVSYIFKHFKLIEDLLFRMKKSGIKGLEDISKESLKGETKSDYMIFTYTIKIKGPLDAVRGFMNSLLKAYKDNRIYVVKSVSLQAEEDARSIIDSKGLATPGSRGGEKSEDLSKDIIGESGVPIIGNNPNITAAIKFKYYIYIGDELTEND